VIPLAQLRSNLRVALAALLRVIRANRRHVHVLLTGGFVLNLLGLLVPMFSMIVYDRIIGNDAYASLAALAIGMVLAGLLELVLRQARVQIVEHVGARWDRALDERVVLGLLNASLLTPPELGPVLSRYRDVLATRDFLSAAYVLPVTDLPFVLVYLLAIYGIGGPIVLVAATLGIALLVVSLLSYRLGRARHMRALGRTNEKISLLAEIVVALETLRRRRSAQRAAGRFLALSDAVVADAAQARVWMAFPGSATPVLAIYTTVATLALGVYLVDIQAITTGALIACSMLCGRCVMLFGSVAALWNRFEDFTRAMAELGATLDLAEEPAGRAARKAPRPRLPAPSFVLVQMGFSRPNAAHAVFQDVSLEIAPGECVALLGRAGSGKSTLLRVLAGRLSPTSGALVVGGVPVASQRAGWLADCVGYKAQDPQFLTVSIDDLLRDAAPHLPARQRLDMLRAVGLGRALDAGEISLATRVGAFGVGVSGGQRQMLALACAFLQGEDVLLLDEPTLGLDAEAQRQVLGLLAALKGRRTMIIATHAPEIIALCERVILVGEGRILADGPRAKLVASPIPAPPTPTASPASGPGSGAET
jgi:ABC-type bacteriocin/lantibiotic exporter with double-glycine peptidase domain